MPILQAPPTSQPVTHRAAALARGDGSARTTAAAPQPGERGHLRHTLLAAIAVRHYSRRTAQAYWHWTRQFILWSGKQHPLDMGAPEVGAFLTHLTGHAGLILRGPVIGYTAPARAGNRGPGDSSWAAPTAPSSGGRAA